MKNLIKFELSKVFKHKIFYVVTATILFVSFLYILRLNSYYNPAQSQLSGYSVMEESIYNVSAFINIVGLYIAIMVNMDYNQGTLKNIYSRGFKRSEVFFAKLIITIIACSIMFVVTIFFCFGLGVAFFGTEIPAHYQNINYFLLMLGQYIASMAFCISVFSLCNIVQKPIYAYLVGGIGFHAVEMFLSIISSASNFNIDDHILERSFSINNYVITNTISQFRSFEVANCIDQSKFFWVRIVISFMYIAVFLPVGLCVSNKSDIK